MSGELRLPIPFLNLIFHFQARLFVNMGEFRRLAALMWAASALSLASATCSSESGEVATSLNIVNAEMAPDGFRRS